MSGRFVQDQRRTIYHQPTFLCLPSFHFTSCVEFMNRTIQVVIHGSQYSSFLQICSEIHHLHVHVHSSHIHVKCAGGVQEMWRQLFGNGNVVNEDMQRPSLCRMELESLLPARSCATSNDLFLVGTCDRLFENMHIFDVEQVDSFLESTVHDNETHLLTMYVVISVIEILQHLLFRFYRYGLIIYID